MENPIILREEDLRVLLNFGKEELMDQGVVVVLQRSNELPIVEKEIGEFGTGSFHAIVPVEIGRYFKTVYLIPAERKD